ncbi:probable cytochrome P450 301a1, mitochondrial [Ixodes scapularis]|uniref:probable cytochrome P450 301a1, mitochondrial n=1 Tax=Ixodes scapularis TaxID=6945 RepID=UPI001C385AF4|nr:probable cytochrome P450 301a1, mitochondrial [Ixodes scapularis]
MKAARVLLQGSRRAAHLGPAAAPAADGTHGESRVAAKPFGQMPRVPSFPLVGSSWIYWPLVGKYHPDRRHEAALDMHRQYGPIVAEKLPGRYSLVHLFSADDFHALYQHEGKTPFRMGATAFKKYRSSRPKYYKNIGILNMQGQEWYNVRSKTQPYTLRPRTIMSYVPGMDKIAEDTLRVLARDRDARGETADCYKLLYKWALESVVYASLDTRVGCLSVPLDPHSDGAMILKDMDDVFACLQIFGYRFPYFRYFRTPSWKRFEFAMDDFTIRLFKHIEAAAERLKTRTEDREYTILEYLLAEKKLEFGEILAFMSDFILGGADTTSATATFCLYHLARNPEAQERARQEVFDVVGNKPRALEPEHLSHLPFLKACVKEALRLNPTLSGVFRKLDHDVTLSGYLVPAGTPLFTENYVASRLEENFTRADQFLPERWLKRDDEGRQDWALHPFASLPFSFGPRMCLGRRMAELEVWIMLVKLLLKYRIEYHYEDIGVQGKLANAPDKPARYRFVDLH